MNLILIRGHAGYGEFSPRDGYVCVCVCVCIFASKSGIEYFINSWNPRVDAWTFDNFYTVFPAAV